mgnify:CR=1 FL=1
MENIRNKTFFLVLRLLPYFVFQTTAITIVRTSSNPLCYCFLYYLKHILMKTLSILLLMIFSVSVANAQIDILGKIEEKVEQKVDQKTDEAIDKAREYKEKKEASESEKKE